MDKKIFNCLVLLKNIRDVFAEIIIQLARQYLIMVDRLDTLDLIGSVTSDLSSLNVMFVTLNASEESHLSSGDSSLRCAPLQNDKLELPIDSC